MTSKRACWTCTLRRKKCSAEHPICLPCKRLNVTCYGYGEKPLWMDGGVQEKSILVEIQEGVRATTDGQRRTRALQGAQASKDRRGLKDSTISSASKNSISDGLHESSEFRLFNETVSPSSPISLLSKAPVSQLPWSSDPQVESFLLMHYLDTVFPLQFPFYNPSSSEGGRGWILHLLMQIKPLYDSTLALAAYHQAISGSCKGGGGRLAKIFTDQNRFSILALQGLRHHLGELVGKGETPNRLQHSIEALACITHLTMLEVAQGGTENWQQHLMAVPNIVPFLKVYCPVMQLLTEPSSAREALNSQELQKFETVRSTLSFADHDAMIFYSTVCIWFDTLGCISTGLGPQCFDIRAGILGDNSKLQLQKIMGCENWVMILIWEIAVLMDLKRRLCQGHVLKDRDLRCRAVSIEQSLKHGIVKLDAKLINNEQNMMVHKVTHAFACAAQVYLQVLLHGPVPEQMQQAVSSTLAALSSLSEAGLLRNAVWPFCIAGCMASKAQHHAFCNLASAGGMCKSGFVFGTSRRAFEVVTTCWRIREQEARHCEWLDAMENLGYRVLLV